MHPIADYWDRAAEEFDREPDHGLGHPPTRAAWAARLAAWIPDAVRRHAFDVVLARHLLWTLPDPPAVLRRWVGLLRPRGRLVLVEGRWASATAAGPYAAAGSDATGVPDTGGATLPWLGGVAAAVLSATLAPMVATLDIEPLTDPALWGRTVNDERYAALARLA